MRLAMRWKPEHPRDECALADDCHPWPDSCVIGCGRTINKRHIPTLEDLLDRYENEQAAEGMATRCNMRCAPLRGVDCVEGHCVRAREP